MTPTTQLADYILPKTTLLEEEAVFVEGSCLAAIQAATPARGESRTDVEIAIALRDELRKKNLIAYVLIPWNSHREFIDYQLRDSGFSFEDVCIKGFISFPATYESYKKDGFKTPSGKIELAPSKLRDAGYDAVPDFRRPSYASV